MRSERGPRRATTETAAQANQVARAGRKHLSLFARIWKYPRISQLRPVVNPRLKSTVARWLPPGDTIEIGVAATSRGMSALHEILGHEAAHVVVWNRFGRASRPHGPEWAALMRAAGLVPHATLVRCGARRRPTTGVRVRHTCTVCHFSVLAKRKMPRWRCPECRSIGLEGTLRMERIVTR